MKILAVISVLLFALSFSCPAYADSDDDRDSGGNQTLTGALMGGLLGGGLGTAIGSVSGNAGKGALIGAGIGAVGGALVGANQPSKRRQANAKLTEPETTDKTVTEGADVPSDAQVKRRVIKQYDAQGNLVSGKEMKN